MGIRENLLELRRAVAEWPEQEFDLSRVVQKHACGTLYCAAGIVGVTPYFQSMGYSLLHGGLSFGGQMGRRYVDKHFGDCAWGRLFEQRQLGGFDRLLTGDMQDGLDGTITDKMLALARIDKQLELYP